MRAAGALLPLVRCRSILGLFDGSTYQLQSSCSSPPYDQVTSEANVEPSPYAPLQTSTVSGGTFTMTLPPGTANATYYLIAWDDSNSNGKLDAFTTEVPYFATKSFPQESAAVRYITAASYAGQGEYAAGYYRSAMSYIQCFSIVGTSGFDFSTTKCSLARVVAADVREAGLRGSHAKEL